MQYLCSCVLFTAENDRVTIQVRLARRTSPRVAMQVDIMAQISTALRDLMNNNSLSGM